MPIVEKIDRAKKEYAVKLDAFRRATAEDKPETTAFEKDLIRMLTDMIEIKTEIEILTRVENHRNAAH